MPALRPLTAQELYSAAGRHVPELKRLTPRDLDRMQEITADELPPLQKDNRGANILASAFSKTMLGPEWDEGEDWDRIGSHLSPGVDMFLYSTPVAAVPYTVLNADWKDIANSKSTIDAISRFLDTGMPGLLDIVGLGKLNALDFVLPAGLGAATEIADYKRQHPSPQTFQDQAPVQLPTKTVKPTEDILWETYKP